jgi:diguanylate cyclase (GGDEF)-like protein
VAQSRLSSDKRKLVAAVSLLLAVGFAATALANYFISRAAISDSIVASALPLTSDNIYSEIQKDLLRPVLISSVMSADTFLHDWVRDGERDIGSITRYLREIRDRYGAVTSFFISERTRLYYQAGGVLKKVSPDDTRDAWYFRVRSMKEPYELNFDLDAANRDAITIFINYRVLDYAGQYIGVAGVGLTVEAVRRLIETYQERYRRSVYFVDKAGMVSLIARGSPLEGKNIKDVEGLKDIAAWILEKGSGTFRYRGADGDHVINVRFIQELKWYLFVAQDEDQALSAIRRTLYIDLGISALVTAIVLLLTTLTIGRYQRRLESMATTDELTGLPNRQAFSVLVPPAIRESERNNTPLLALMMDLDHFKSVNDRFGHAAGDVVLEQVGQVIQQSLRASDFVFRWGGEEFLVVVKSGGEGEGVALAEKIRRAVGTKRIEHGTNVLGLTISVGVAAHHKDESIDAWLARADRALYRAKEEGRNAVRVG